MNKELEKNLIALLNEKEQSVKLSSEAPHNLASLKEKIFQLEFQREIKAIRAMLSYPDDSFPERFQARCRWRSHSPEENIFLNEFPESITNRLYWDVALLVFNPRNMSEMLPVILGEKQLVLLDVSLSDTLPEEALLLRSRGRARSLEIVLEEVEQPNSLIQEPTLDSFSHFVVFENMILNVEEIIQYPLHFHAKLLEQLKKKYPGLAQKLYSHNFSLRRLIDDIRILNTKGTTVKSSLEQLIQGLLYGGERVTGSLYAKKASYEAIEKFLSYFKTLSVEHQEQLRQMKGLKWNGNLGALIDNLFSTEVELCVETAAAHLRAILKAEDNQYLLTPLLEMTEESLHELEQRYRYIPGRTILDSKKDNVFGVRFPEQLMKKAFQGIAPQTGGDLIILLQNLPAACYNMLWEQIRLSHPVEILNEVALAIKNDFLINEREKLALAQAIIKHYGRFSLEYSLLSWAILCNHSLILQEALKTYSENEKQTALQSEDQYGATVLHYATNNLEHFKIILGLFPESLKKTAMNKVDKCGRTILHYAVFNPYSLKSIVEFYLETRGLYVLNLSDKSGNTLLHHAASTGIPESLEIMLGFYPEEQRLLRIQMGNANGNTVLHCAANNLPCLEIILKLYPEGQKLPAVQEVNKQGDTVLHCAANNLRCLERILSLYPEVQKLPAVQVVNKQGDTVLHCAASNLQCLEMVLNLYPEAQKLPAVHAVNKQGDTVLHCMTGNPHCLEMILKLYFKEKQVHAINTVNKKNGNTVLHCAVSTPKSLKMILELYPESERLLAVRIRNKQGYTVLHEAANNPKSLEILLKSLPENQRLSGLQLTDKNGLNVLYFAVNSPKSLKVILRLLPEKERFLFLKAVPLSAHLLWDYLTNNHITISSSEKEFKDSFILDFIRISRLLAETNKNHHGLFRYCNEAAQLRKSINRCNDFDEIKVYLINYMKAHVNKPLTKQLLNEFGLTNNTEQDIAVLKQQWGIHENSVELMLLKA